MSNEVALISLNDIEKMASVMGKNGMFGKTPDQLLPLMLIAQAEGKHPAIVAQEYDVINGRPALNSRAALSRFQSCGGRIEWIERNDKKASAKFWHAQGGELVVTWDWERATAANLTNKATWRQYPAQMLSSRVVAEGVRAIFPGCLSGFYTSEEVQDFDQPKSQRHTSEPRNVTNEEVFNTPEAQVKPAFEIVEDERVNWPRAKIVAEFSVFSPETDQNGNIVKSIFTVEELEIMRNNIRSIKTNEGLIELLDKMKNEMALRINISNDDTIAKTVAKIFDGEIENS